MNPIECLEAFLDATIRQDISTIYENWQMTFRHNHKIGEVTNYSPKHIFDSDLVGYEILDETEHTPVVRDIKVKLELKDGRKFNTVARILKEHAPYEPCINCNCDKGRWGVNPISVLRQLK